MSPTGPQLAIRAKRLLGRQPLILLALLIPVCFVVLTTTPAGAGGSTPTPEPDPLAIPIVPENPSAIDLGQVTYYYHCMPCHGDKGQGLTDEWRGVWVEDHQDCWSRGCHGGKPDDLGFPIPRSVPPIMPPFSRLTRFETLDGLAAFLHDSHPPQSPGVLDEEDCLSLAAYLTQSLPLGNTMEVGTTVTQTENGSISGASVFRALAALGVTLGLAWLIGSGEAGPA
jgi:hypothetical protein